MTTREKIEKLEIDLRTCETNCLDLYRTIIKLREQIRHLRAENEKFRAELDAIEGLGEIEEDMRSI